MKRQPYDTDLTDAEWRIITVVPGVKTAQHNEFTTPYANGFVKPRAGTQSPVPVSSIANR